MKSKMLLLMTQNCQYELQGKDDSFRIAWLVLAVAYIVPATLWVSW